MPDTPSVQSFYDAPQNSELRAINDKLNNIISIIERNHLENVKRLDDHEARLRDLENKRLPELERDFEGLSARVNIFGAIQTAYATAVAAVAAFLGMKP